LVSIGILKVPFKSENRPFRTLGGWHGRAHKWHGRARIGGESRTTCACRAHGRAPWHVKNCWFFASRVKIRFLIRFGQRVPNTWTN